MKNIITAILMVMFLVSCNETAFQTSADYQLCIDGTVDMELFTDQEKIDLSDACREETGHEGICAFADLDC